MLIKLNGDEFEATEDASVAGLLGQLQIARERVAVEVNMDIVPKPDYDSRILSAGDIVEIVHFVGGG